jgi:hypothetical protein
MMDLLAPLLTDDQIDMLMRQAQEGDDGQA